MKQFAFTLLMVGMALHMHAQFPASFPTTSQKSTPLLEWLQANQAPQDVMDWAMNRAEYATSKTTDFSNIYRSYIYSTWDNDNSVWRYEYTYSRTLDENGGALTETLTDTVTNTPQTRTVNTYNELGFPILAVTERWQSPGWVADLGRAYTYNAFGFEASIVLMNWDGSQWDSVQKTVRLFDEVGNFAGELNYNWSPSTNDWVVVFGYQSESISDEATGQLLQVTTQIWDTQAGAFINSSRTQYSYNTQGQINAVRTLIWLDNEWVKFQLQLQFRYAESGQQLGYTIREWNGSSWENRFRISQESSEDGLTFTYLREEWIMDAWQNEFRFTYTGSFDGSYNRTQQEEWDAFTAQWVVQNGVEEIRTFDVLGRWDEYYINAWNPTINDYQYDERYQYGYEEITTHIHLPDYSEGLHAYLKEGLLEVKHTDFPMEAEAVSVSVVNMQGQEVAHIETRVESLRQGVSMDISAYSGGVYIIQAKGTTATANCRIIKR